MYFWRKILINMMPNVYGNKMSITEDNLCNVFTIFSQLIFHTITTIRQLSNFFKRTLLRENINIQDDNLKQFKVLFICIFIYPMF